MSLNMQWSLAIIHYNQRIEQEEQEWGSKRRKGRLWRKGRRIGQGEQKRKKKKGRRRRVGRKWKEEENKKEK